MPKVTISPAALKVVKQLLARAGRDPEVNLSSEMPVFGWEIGMPNERNFVPGKILGLHPRNLVPRDCVINECGLKIAINFPEYINIEKESVIDFSNGTFTFYSV